MVPCYVCGKPCYDHSTPWSNYHSCCLACSIDVHNEVNGNGVVVTQHKVNPNNGDGFSPTSAKWMTGLNAVKTRHHNHLLMFVINCGSVGMPKPLKTNLAESKTKKYPNNCPCEILSSNCDYHRNM